MDILNTVVAAIQQFALLIVILGMITAFLARLAFYVNLVIGFLLTIIITYLVYSFTQNIGTAAVIIVIGVVGSFTIAAIGHILCLIEAFGIIMLGIWAFLVAGSPSEMFSSQNLVISAIASAILTLISAFIGGQLLTSLFPSGKIIRSPVARRSKSPSDKPTYSGTTMPTKKEGQVSSPPESVQQPAPTTIPVEQPTRIEKVNSLLTQKRENERKLDNLNKVLEEKKIDQEMYNRLNKEFQHELAKIKIDLLKELEKVSEEVKTLKEDLTRLEIEKQAKVEMKKEIKARYLIKDITKEDYKSMNNLKKTEINNIKGKILTKKVMILKLTKILEEAKYAPKMNNYKLD